MPEHILSLLGKPFVLPASFLLIGAWALNKLMALHDSKSRNRIDFLERWGSVDSMDDLRLEVTVRHLFGTYLPAEIIRTICRMPFPSQALLNLGTIWPLVEYDPIARQLKWKRQGYGQSTGRRWYRVAFICGYVVLALIGLAFLHAAIESDPSKATAWIVGIGGLVLFAIAGSCFAQFDMLRDVERSVGALVAEINTTMRTQAKRRSTEMSSEIASRP